MRYIGFLCDYRRWLAGDEMSFADLAAAGAARLELTELSNYGTFVLRKQC